MKKLLAIVLMLMFAVTAFAEPAVEFNWSDFEAATAEIEGQFFAIADIGLKMWVPTALPELELTQEDYDQGYICYFQPEDGSAGVGVQYANVDGMSLDDYAAALPEYGATGIQKVVVNGIEALGYDLDEDNASVLAFTTDTGYVIEFAFAPMSDEGFASLAAIMMASIQAA